MKKYTATDYDVVDGSSVTDYNLWPQFSDHSDGYDYSSLYAAIFPPDLSLSHSPVTPPTIGESASAGATRTIVADYNQNQSLDFAPFQDLIDRRDWCLAHLGITAKEAEALRQENINLQLANTELNRRLNLLQRSASLRNSLSLPSQYTAAPPPPAIVDSLREMRIAEKPTTSERRAWKDFTPAAAARGIENQDPLKSSRDLDRVKLPKSISVRSNGYVKASQAGDGHGPRSRSADRFKTADQMQKVYVHGERKEEQPLELQVYNQGMTKTELCNKWEETGTCPYGDNCQFAHGIEELRPVLRHPRYKTEVCRMVLSGDPCPYGHRCHFRHALTDEEKLMSRQITSRRLLQLTR